MILAIGETLQLVSMASKNIWKISAILYLASGIKHKVIIGSLFT